MSKIIVFCIKLKDNFSLSFFFFGLVATKNVLICSHFVHVFQSCIHFLPHVLVMIVTD